jgi:hypothetical protein
MMCRNVISPPGLRNWLTKSTRNFIFEVRVIGIRILLYNLAPGYIYHCRSSIIKVIVRGWRTIA